MPTKRRIVIADLDEPTRSIVNECLPHDHFEITEFDESESSASSPRVDLVIFRAPKDLEQTQAFCVRFCGPASARALRRWLARDGTSIL